MSELSRTLLSSGSSVLALSAGLLPPLAADTANHNDRARDSNGQSNNSASMVDRVNEGKRVNRPELKKRTPPKAQSLCSKAIL